MQEAAAAADAQPSQSTTTTHTLPPASEPVPIAAHARSRPASAGRRGVGVGHSAALQAAELVVDDVEETDMDGETMDGASPTLRPAVAALASATASLLSPTTGPSGAGAGSANSGRAAPATTSPSKDVLLSGRGTVVGTALALNASSVAAAGLLVKEMELRPSKITIETAAQLRALLFGVAGQSASGAASSTREAAPPRLRCLNEEWMSQGFYFAQEPGLQYGLLQTRGGPCGALACVQGDVVKHLFYSDVSLFDGPTAADTLREMAEGVAAGVPGDVPWTPLQAAEVMLDPSAHQQQRALVLAITDVIWRAALSSHSGGDAPVAAKVAIVDDSLAAPGARSISAKTVPRTLAMPSLHASGPPVPVVYQGDGLTEWLKVFTCATKWAVAAVVEAFLPLFTRVDGPGVPLVVYSAILSRGIAGARGDMDVGMTLNPTFIGEHSYATQELVNLLLTGRARSNVFDGDRTLAGDDGSGDEVHLHGIPARSDVGFLTLFESYQYMQCGSHLKQPRVPVWVMCAESHYSVLFAAPLGATLPPDALDKVARQARKGTRIAAWDDRLCLGLHAATNDSAPFYLFVFDGLARQDAVIRITVTPHAASGGAGGGAGSRSLKRTADDPPLELVLSTRWPGASFDWNGTDPLL